MELLPWLRPDNVDGSLLRVDERKPDPVLLDPGDAAFMNDGRVVCHNEAKSLGTKAGFSTSMAAPSGEMLRIMQRITEPPDET